MRACDDQQRKGSCPPPAPLHTAPPFIRSLFTSLQAQCWLQCQQGQPATLQNPRGGDRWCSDEHWTQRSRVIASALPY